MQFKNLIILSAAVSAETVQLSTMSSKEDVNGKGISSLHEGAGINYAFLSSGSDTLDYDESTKFLSVSYDTYSEYFTIDSGFVGVSVSPAPVEVTFDKDNNLLVDGSSEGFYGCKNTNDPYDNSESSYELMYYSGNSTAPDGCLPLTVVKVSGAGNKTDTGTKTTTSTGTETTSSTVSCTETKCQPQTTAYLTTFTGGAEKFGSAGILALGAGAFAALL
ncbi:hypothetical protein FOA43_002494 [Brettanomyces nanus]|uniref:DUF7907 domain-containing protein n=1 Tax=Eeniella nana TaxID=13502 RepID=A0A875S5X9_EENNA|nr:uncharacterized protein FOA43_002494 [Brettanomyces nanus]QPG75149.1 hypothetical protein FOA43_002494 [Brettanomyces nanus]